MTVTLHLKPEVEAGLQARADASGMMLEEYLLTVVEGAALAGKKENGSSPIDRAEAVNRMLEFGEKHRLSFGATITRASMHEGHRY